MAEELDSVPTKEEIEEVLGIHERESRKKHHLTFLIYLGVIVLLIGSYVYFEDELIEYTGRSIGINESVVESLKSFFIEEIDVTNKSRFGVGLSEIYIDLNQEEKALIALLEEQCTSEKGSLESEVRDEEEEECEYEKSSLQTEIETLETNLVTCEAEVSDLESELSSCTGGV